MWALCTSPKAIIRTSIAEPPYGLNLYDKKLAVHSKVLRASASG